MCYTVSKCVFSLKIGKTILRSDTHCYECRILRSPVDCLCYSAMYGKLPQLMRDICSTNSLGLFLLLYLIRRSFGVCYWLGSGVYMLVRVFASVKETVQAVMLLGDLKRPWYVCKHICPGSQEVQVFRIAEVGLLTSSNWEFPYRCIGQTGFSVSGVRNFSICK